MTAALLWLLAAAMVYASGRHLSAALSRRQELRILAARIAIIDEDEDEDETEALSIEEWIEDVADGCEFRVRIVRRLPTAARGLMGMVDETIDEDWLAQRYGGGLYELTVIKMRPDGKNVFTGTRKVPIAGDPIAMERQK